MTNDTTKLPLVVTSSSGAGGVSPRVSMMPDVIAEQAQLLELTFKQIVPSSPEEAQELAAAMKGNLEEVSRVLERVYRETTASTHAFNDTLVEATRSNVNEALHFLQDIAGATGPAEVMAIQADYANRQFQSFAKQIQDIQKAFGAIFEASAKPIQAELVKSTQRFRSC